MDISEKQAFEAEFEKTDFYKMNLVNCFCFITDRYVWDEVQAAWEMWQAATTRMEILINTLDEMLLNQGEALAQAKAQAVPEPCVSVEAHQIIIDEVKTEINEGYELCQDSYLLDVLVHRGIQIGKAQAVPEWISTSERMPEEGEEVLVHSFGQVRQVTRDSKWAGGFKERNCYGWQAAYSQSHWMPKSIELPEQYHFYYENDAKQKATLEAQEQAND